MKFAFIHIPKTGGTTIGSILKTRFNVYHKDINKKPKNYETYDICMGHFWPSIYEGYPCVTWFRKPMERMVSHYSYFKLRVRKENKHSIVICPKKVGDTAQKKMKSKTDLITFAEKIGNAYVDYASNLHAFSFIGFLETMDYSLNQFGKMFNFTIPNSIPIKRKGVIEEVTAAEREKLKSMLKPDMQLYREAREKYGR